MLTKMRKFIKFDQKGFTLTEVMVSIATSSVIAYALFTSLRTTVDQVNTSTVKMTAQTSAREGLYRMIQEIRTSAPDKITIGTSGTTGSSLTFYVPDPASPVTASYGVNWGHQIRYALGTGSNSTRLIRTDLTSNTTKVMASDVTAISFTGNSASPDLVTVTMSLQRALANGRNVTNTAMQITGQAKIRNASSGESDDDEDDGSDHGSDDDSDHGSDDGSDHGSDHDSDH